MRDRRPRAQLPVFMLHACMQLLLTMSLFRFRFRPLAPVTSEINEADFCSTVPTLSESGLGVVEYWQVTTAVNKELAAPPANGDMVVVLTHLSNVQ